MSKLEEILKNTVIDFDAFFHLLRHFYKIDEDFQASFTNQTHYNDEDIKYLMDKPGSKFKYSFAKNPDDLIKNLAIQVDYKSFYISEVGSKIEVSIEFDREVFPKGIGFDGIAAIRNLEEHERTRIIKVERDGYQLKKLNADKKNTWKLNLILHKTKDKYLISNFSPGIYSPPFPNKEIQKNDLYEKSVTFWNDHVLLI